MNHIMIDGTYVHAHKHSAGARHTSGINQALGRSRGGFTSKIHAVVDALGNLLAFTVTAGQYSEYPQAEDCQIRHFLYTSRLWPIATTRIYIFLSSMLHKMR